MGKMLGVAIGFGIGAVAVATSFYAGVFYGACVMDDAYRDGDEDVKGVARDYAKMVARVYHDGTK